MKDGATIQEWYPKGSKWDSVWGIVRVIDWTIDGDVVCQVISTNRRESLHRIVVAKPVDLSDLKGEE